MKRALLIALVTVGFLIAAAPSTAVDRALRSSAGKQADFVQRFTPHGFKSEQVERGTVVFGAAPRMRWQYTSPESKLFLFDGSTSWLYSPADRQVTVTRLGEKEKQEIPFVILADEKARQKFRITEQQKGNTITAQIRPGDGSAAVRLAVVTIDRGTGLVRTLTYTDRQGNRTVFQFTNYRTAPQRDLTFQFKAPAGVDVVEANQRER